MRGLLLLLCSAVLYIHMYIRKPVFVGSGGLEGVISSNDDLEYICMLRV